MVIQKWVGARVGLMGNPSDGFGGKTIACLIGNFGAGVTLRESRTVEIVRHPLFDPLSFSSLAHLEETAANDGYYGGIRLLYATCKKFYEYCRDHNISLPDRNFTLQYDTNIPRQVGLGGSSAIITAALKAIMEFYGLGDEHIPTVEQPNLILAVETEELGITAGLQDRVVQVYGGLVYMDFDDANMRDVGHGYYEELEMESLPPMYLAYSSNGCDSGAVHSIVKHRFNEGDPDVMRAVETWRVYTDEARRALLDRNWRLFSGLMDLNFDLRREIYGDEHIGAHNLHMVRIARRLGLPSKFAGSGGAVVGVCEDESQFTKAKQTFEEHGYHFAHLHPATYEEQMQSHPVAEANGVAMQLSVV